MTSFPLLLKSSTILRVAKGIELAVTQNLSVTLHAPDHGLGASIVPFAPYDYIILYNMYKVNNTDCTFCKIRNDYYIVYNANYGLGERYDKWDC